ncbi:MAG: FAD-dependent oxidoreductase [Spirochaetes bacterium]|nr:FAD-dependent oxidoreductase [Spirochaetota bacterium]
MSTATVHIPSHDVPVAHECDICIVGGSVTGVFAAVRAARLGASVALVEQNTMLGGTATAALVNAWHSVFDVAKKEKIIGGLLDEVVTRLRSRNAIRDITPIHRDQYNFNAAEMSVELDALLLEHNVRPFLSAKFSMPVMDGSRIAAVIIEDKGGRRAIRARMFIDASGDGDLVRRAGFPAVKHDILQPVSYQSLAYGIEEVRKQNPGVDIWSAVRPLADEFKFPGSNPWFGVVPHTPELSNIFGPRLNGVDASDPDVLTRTLMEGRRISRAFLDMIRKRFGESAAKVVLVAAAPMLGVRETWHAQCLYRMTQDDLLYGKKFDDAVGYGTYPVDIHHPGGTSLLYLDGREELVSPAGGAVWKRWRPETEATPPYFQIPLRCLIPEHAENLLVAGRIIDADKGAYGALRVQVNCNQTGEAAGVAAWQAVSTNVPVHRIDAANVRSLLAKGGSIIR